MCLFSFTNWTTGVKHDLHTEMTEVKHDLQTEMKEMVELCVHILLPYSRKYNKFGSWAFMSITTCIMAIQSILHGITEKHFHWFTNVSFFFFKLDDRS